MSKRAGQEYLNQVINSTPLERFCTVDDIANVIDFLVSD